MEVGARFSNTRFKFLKPFKFEPKTNIGDIAVMMRMKVLDIKKNE